MSRDTRGRSFGALLAEALMVVFAVLVALAVDEWREHREILAQVARAEAGVEAELRANQEELLQGSASVQAMYDSISSVVTRLQAGEVVREAGLGGNLPEFSDAAWETARVTGAVAHMPYQRVLETARVYETQALVRQAQSRVLFSFGDIVARGLQVDLLQELQGELFITLQIYASLAQRYDEALRAGEGPP